jgi:hypothetical protein
LAPETQPIVTVSNWERFPRTDQERASYVSFVRSVLEHNPRVKKIIVWNEPAKPDWPYYCPLLNAVSPVIRSFGAKVLGPDLHPAVPVSYEQSLIDDIAADCNHSLDIFTTHGYWQDVAEVIARVRATMGRNIPVWVTEEGVQSAPPPGLVFHGSCPTDASLLPAPYLYCGQADALWDGGLPESDAAAQAASRIKADVCAGANVVLTFLLRDWWNLMGWQSAPERPDGTHKPYYAALSQTNRRLSAGQYTCPVAPPSGGKGSEGQPKLRTAIRSHRPLKARVLCKAGLRRWCHTLRHRKHRKRKQHLLWNLRG